MKHKLLSFVLVLAFLLSTVPSTGVSANDYDNPSDATVARVYEEILSGNITSEEDVLRVALAQDAERAASASNNSRSATQSTDTDDSSPMISQVLETTTDEDGHLVYLIADTGLLVVDENGEAVNRHYLRTTETFDDLDITARHTVYYYLKLSDALGNPQVKFYRVSTMVFYSGTERATKLNHYYCYAPSGIPQDYLIGTHTNLSDSSVYTNTYSSADWRTIRPDSNYPGFGTKAHIYYESNKYKSISIDVNDLTYIDPTGTW